MPPELTEERIAEAMARAEKVACRPGEGRCYALPEKAIPTVAASVARGSGSPPWTAHTETPQVAIND
jgi:hypothetical protein